MNSTLSENRWLPLGAILGDEEEKRAVRWTALTERLREGLIKTKATSVTIYEDQELTSQEHDKVIPASLWGKFSEIRLCATEFGDIEAHGRAKDGAHYRYSFRGLQLARADCSDLFVAREANKAGRPPAAFWPQLAGSFAALVLKEGKNILEWTDAEIIGTLSESLIEHEPSEASVRKAVVAFRQLVSPSP